MNRNSKTSTLLPETHSLIAKAIISMTKKKNIHKQANKQANIQANKQANIQANIQANTNSNNTNSGISRISKTTTKHKTHIRSKNVNYISELINLYYNNDTVSNNYLASANKITHIFPPQNRIIVIGDIHGDFEVAIKCLILAKCIEYIEPPVHKSVDVMDAFFHTLKWIGGDTYIVQLGDQIDRVRPQRWDRNDISRDAAYEDEGSTLEIFYLFHHLDKLARAQQGRVLSIIGNHEIMNVDGDFRYVSTEEFRCFKEHLKHVYNHKSKFPYHSRTLKKSSYILKNNKNNENNSKSTLPIGYRERLYAFSPSGLCANLIAKNYYTMLQIGNWLFCHGSPTLHISKNYSIDLVNNVVALYLLGIDSVDDDLEKHFDEIMKPHVENESSILWDRTFGETIDGHSREQYLEKHLQKILNEYNKKNYNLSDNMKATHIAIGHTPQFKHGINSICNQRVWRCDVGMSKAFQSKKIKSNKHNGNTGNTGNTDNYDDDNAFERGDVQVLEIVNGNPTTLS
jgi:hypothetical protein